MGPCSPTPPKESVGWLTSRWEDIDPRAEGRPARRYYQLTPDGLELARAALPLPSEHRYRYRQEFLAELYGMTPSQQLHHATGILSRVWTLRMALNDPARLTAKEPAMAKPWRCRIGMQRWRIERDYQGKRYRECRHCGAVSGTSMTPPSTPGI